MRDADNIADIAAIKPDYMGFIFYPPSPRCCIGIDREVIARLPEGVKPVMVCVNMNENEVLAIAHRYGFHTIQLHGNESPEMCSHLRNAGLTIIKAMGIKTIESLNTLRQYDGTIDFFLLDTQTASKGGSGKKFDWSIIDAYDLDTPFFLSGGIGPDDADAILSLVHSKFEGIDLNSRFEITPGIKNTKLLLHFISQILN